MKKNQYEEDEAYNRYAEQVNSDPAHAYAMARVFGKSEDDARAAADEVRNRNIQRNLVSSYADNAPGGLDFGSYMQRLNDAQDNGTGGNWEIQITDPKAHGYYNYSAEDYGKRLSQEQANAEVMNPYQRVLDRVLHPFAPRVNVQDAMAEFHPEERTYWQDLTDQMEAALERGDEEEYNRLHALLNSEEAYAQREQEAGNGTTVFDQARAYIEKITDPSFTPRQSHGSEVNWHPEEKQITGSEEAAAAAEASPTPDKISHRGTDILNSRRTVVDISNPATETERPEMQPAEQYIYPEDGRRMRFQSQSPFEDWQKELIDEMNTAYENHDYAKQKELLDTYNAGQDAYSRYRYEGSIEEGQTPYQGITDALIGGDPQAYAEARNALAENGYSDDMMDDQTADWIHQNGGDIKDQETMLQDYLGLSPTDAEATSILWWWTDNNGKAEADTDENGRLKQDELGTYLKGLEEAGTLSDTQAAAIWTESFPTAKTDYAGWKGKGTKKEKSQYFIDADANGNNRLTQAELGAYLMQQGLSDEEAAKIWSEEFPTAKTSYEAWRKKQK